MITLTMPQILAACRAAFDQNQLQAQVAPNPDAGCLYAGPCAIGAAMEPGDRVICDDVLTGNGEDSAIEQLIEHHKLVSMPSL